jgi:hypothetical protein
MSDKGKLIPFGKYKDQPIEHIQTIDRPYLEWLLKQAWFRDRFPQQHQIVINYGGEPSETPEHNRLQARLLDEAFRIALANLFAADLVAKLRRGIIAAHEREQKDLNEAVTKANATVARHQESYECEKTHLPEYIAQLRADLNSGKSSRYFAPDLTHRIQDAEHRLSVLDERWAAEAERYAADVTKAKTTLAEHANGRPAAEALAATAPNWACGCEFEVKGWDAVMHCTAWLGSQAPAYLESQLMIGIECKPTLGDDYPAVLRQIKNHGDQFTRVSHRVLLVEQVIASGATADEIKRFFAASNVYLVMVSSVEAILAA